MKIPFIITNFKNYPSAIGKNAELLTEIHKSVAQKTNKNLAVAVSQMDIAYIAKKYGNDIPIFAQHVDNAEMGASTGKIVPEYLKSIGVTGTLLNHSEHRFHNFNDLGLAIKSAKKAGLITVVCCENVEEGCSIMTLFNPDFIAVEPPELIGGKISVSTARPSLISESVLQIGKGKVLVGAGIKTGEDVRIAIEKGAIGILLASGVTTAENPAEVLENLVRSISPF